MGITRVWISKLYSPMLKRLGPQPVVSVRGGGILKRKDLEGSFSLYRRRQLSGRGDGEERGKWNMFRYGVRDRREALKASRLNENMQPSEMGEEDTLKYTRHFRGEKLSRLKGREA